MKSLFVSTDKKALFVVLLLAISFNVLSGQTPSPRYGIVLHGGMLDRGDYTAEEEREVEETMKQALLAAKAILEKGGKSLDAAEAAIRLLEDSPLFNAGKGAVFTSVGTNELDASIMDGSNLKAGAVAGVKRIKNPISLARMVMERTKHVLLARDGAEAFAKDQGVEFVDEKYFWTEKRWKRLQEVQREEKAGQTQPKTHGTVGAAVLDSTGNLAAATSTGGVTNKKFGRIGDSPLIGAGTYADNRTCAVSATGTGEFFIRLAVAHDISALMEHRGLSLKEAVNLVIQKKLGDLGGDGGVVALDAKGNIAFSFIGSDGMKRAYLDADGEPVVLMYDKP